MNAQAASAAVAREWQRLDWPRTLLAIVAALASGRALALTEPASDRGRERWSRFSLPSQLSFTREREVPLLYFAAPLFPRILAIVLAIAPACVCCDGRRGVRRGRVDGGAAGGLSMAGERRSGRRLRAGDAVGPHAIRYGKNGLSFPRHRRRSTAPLDQRDYAGPAPGAALALVALWPALHGLRETLTRFDPV